MKITRKLAALALVGAAALGLSACANDAAKVSENLSTAADQFEVQRKIVGVNTRSGDYLFYVEGRCSLSDEATRLVVTCKQSESDYRKHYVGKASEVAWVSTQEAPIDVSEYHTRVIIKPQNVIPDFDLEVGE
ncbi:hypothetical protein SEA_EMOTION_32 [Arthrobacter phage Emotion]|uniref:Lipoprotein n=1 Tax=Arthrobacter phage Emotion TaxID=3038361 RepID=A0AA49ES98_9CAUD|nr:hypothetical protein SEA_EMOTION_32 [Arthrobacter phage Emotion]